MDEDREYVTGSCLACGVCGTGTMVGIVELS